MHNRLHFHNISGYLPEPEALQKVPAPEQYFIGMQDMSVSDYLKTSCISGVLRVTRMHGPRGIRVLQEHSGALKAGSID